MYKFSVRNGVTGKEVYADGDETLRDVFEKSGLEMGNGMMSVDGAMIRAGELDVPISSLNLNEGIGHSMTSVTKLDCACSTTIVGAVAVISSILTPDHIELIKKHKPEALELKDEDKKVVYTLGLTKKEKGSVNKFGASFSTRTNSDGNATITLDLPEVEDRKEYFLEEYGKYVRFINKIEEGLGGTLEEIAGDKAAIAESIAVL